MAVFLNQTMFDPKIYFLNFDSLYYVMYQDRYFYLYIIKSFVIVLRFENNSNNILSQLEYKTKLK